MQGSNYSCFHLLRRRCYAYKLVQACTSGGCGQSNSSSLETLQAMPTSQAAPNVTALNAVTALSNPNGLLIHTCGPSSPLILNTNSSSMSLQWNASLQPEYVITAYTLHHRVPSLKSQSEMWGPPSTATVQFHTYNPSRIFFHQINSVVTDFLGVKLHGGLPWLIFDVGSGPAVVGSNSTRTFNDGQWHTGYMVLFEQASNTFYVTVDKVLQSRPQALHSSWNGRHQCCSQPAQVVAPGHKEHEEPLAVSIP
eukprot:Em0007g1372a